MPQKALEERRLPDASFAYEEDRFASAARVAERRFLGESLELWVSADKVELPSAGRSK